MPSEQLDASAARQYHARPDDPISLLGALLGRFGGRGRAIDRAGLGSYVEAPSASPEGRARIAQLVEHLTFNQEVPGSSPGARTNLLIRNVQG